MLLVFVCPNAHRKVIDLLTFWCSHCRFADIEWDSACSKPLMNFQLLVFNLKGAREVPQRFSQNPTKTTKKDPMPHVHKRSFIYLLRRSEKDSAMHQLIVANFICCRQLVGSRGHFQILDHLPSSCWTGSPLKWFLATQASPIEGNTQVELLENSYLYQWHRPFQRHASRGWMGMLGTIYVPAPLFGVKGCCFVVLVFWCHGNPTR